MCLNNLAADLSSRYKKFGAIEDLNNAIVLDQEALNLCPQGHPNRLISLHNLARHLSTWYTQLGESQDLEDAIFLDCTEGSKSTSGE